MSWWNEYFSDIDTLNIDNVEKWLDEEVSVRFANWPEHHGKTAVIESFLSFWTNLKAVRHINDGIMINGNRVCVEANVTFTRRDDREVSVRAATILERAGEKIKEISVYVDLAPVFEP